MQTVCTRPVKTKTKDEIDIRRRPPAIVYVVIGTMTMDDAEGIVVQFVRVLNEDGGVFWFVVLLRDISGRRTSRNLKR